MRHLDLFSGIGGFALAARWVGWETIGFCEIDPYCQKVLAKHWPGVPIYEDIRRLVADPDIRYLEAEEKIRTRRDESRPCNKDGTTAVGPVDIITGGFPCQDISYAGKGAGIDGERSGLWTEFARIIGEIRPRYAVLENVAALLSRGLDRVAGDLAEIGYDCEWHCIPASAIGAPHRRDRIWIVVYPKRIGCGQEGKLRGMESIRKERQDNTGETEESDTRMADTHVPRLEGWLRRGLQERASERAAGEEGAFRNTDNEGESGLPVDAESWAELPEHAKWLVEPDVGRVADGIPSRVDRLRGLGNAIVPQVAQVIFEAINENMPNLR